MVISEGILRLGLMTKRNRVVSGTGLRTREQLRPMVFEKLLGWLSEFIRQTDRFAFIGNKTPLERRLRQIALQLFAEDNSKLLVQRDQSNVESRVVEGRKTQPVAGIQTLFIRTLAPRLDVTCDQQIRNGNAGNAAANSIRIED